MEDGHRRKQKLLLVSFLPLPTLHYLCSKLPKVNDQKKRREGKVKKKRKGRKARNPTFIFCPRLIENNSELTAISGNANFKYTS